MIWMYLTLGTLIGVISYKSYLIYSTKKWTKLFGDVQEAHGGVRHIDISKNPVVKKYKKIFEMPIPICLRGLEEAELVKILEECIKKGQPYEEDQE